MDKSKELRRKGSLSVKGPYAKGNRFRDENLEILKFPLENGFSIPMQGLSYSQEVEQ